MKHTRPTFRSLRHHRPRQARGFTLIEVLVALVIFALGMLGISLYSGNALRIASTNTARAQALNDSTQVLSAFYSSANGGAASFKAALNAFDDDGNNSYAYARRVPGSTVLVQISAARDSSAIPNNLLTTDASSWVSPLTLGITVIFEGADDDDLTNDRSSRASYTFLLP